MIANYTGFFVYLGAFIFSLACFSRMYMMQRLRAEEGVMMPLRNIERQYKAIVQRGEASLWPVYAEWICAPIGILLVFVAILKAPPAP